MRILQPARALGRPVEAGPQSPFWPIRLGRTGDEGEDGCARGAGVLRRSAAAVFGITGCASAAGPSRRCRFRGRRRWSFAGGCAQTRLANTLPTEARWEYPRRARSRSAFWLGVLGLTFFPLCQSGGRENCEVWPATRTPSRAACSNTPGMATGCHGTRGTATAAWRASRGRYRPNPWGLCDMHGNVWEWTPSAYRPYPCDPPHGREHPTREGLKVIRGGSWRDRPYHCHSAFRWRLLTWQPASTVGFRVALAAD